MDLKTALSKLKTGSGTSLPFFFCEADAKGKPVVLVGPVTADAKAKALAGAKSKKTATGKMSVTADGDLHLAAKGSALSALNKGMTVAAMNAGARGLFKAVVTGAVAEGEDEEETEEKPEAPKSSEVKPTVSPSPSPKPPVKSVKPPVPPAKKFPDVLRKPPEMAKLLDERQVLLAQLDEARKKPGATDKDIEPLAKLVTDVETKLEAAQKKLNATGLTPQAMRPEYQGEDKKMGWNADSIKPKPLVLDPKMTEEEKARAQHMHDLEMARWQAYEESDVTVRKNFSEAEKQNSEISVDAQGRMVDAKGKPIDTRVRGGNEYVTDAETGKMHRFQPEVTDGKQVPRPLRPGQMQAQKVRTHHSSVLSGKEVGGAGGLDVHDGEIKGITNVSGHYKPGAESMVQTVEGLLKQGALLDQKWVDKDGQPLTGKVADLHKGVLALQKQVTKMVQTNPAADVSADLAKIDKAMAALAKLGAGPSNKIKEAKVGVLDIKPGMTGKDVKEAVDSVKANAINAEEFLKTGGGNKEAFGHKSKLQEDLLKKTAKTRADLEKHTVTGEGTTGPGAEEIDATTAELTKGAQELKRARKGEPEAPPQAPPQPPPRTRLPVIEEEEEPEEEVQQQGSKSHYSTFRPKGEDSGVEKEGEEESPLRGKNDYDTPSEDVLRGEGSGVGGSNYDQYAPKGGDPKATNYAPMKGKDDNYDTFEPKEKSGATYSTMKPKGEDSGGESESEEGSSSTSGKQSYDTFQPKDKAQPGATYSTMKPKGEDSGGESESEEDSPLRSEQQGYDTPSEDVLRSDAPTGENYSTMKPKGEGAEEESEQDALRR